MKIGLTEKQYNIILSHVSENQEIREDEEVPSAEPEAGTNAQQSGGQGYPEVGKWESGVTRGPANQVGVTKWADIVGSTLKRGKANQLKEQDAPPMNFDSEDKNREDKENQKKDFNKKFVVYEIPKSSVTKNTSLTLPRVINGKTTTVSTFKTIPTPSAFGFDKWYNDPDWRRVIPTQDNLDQIFYKPGLLRSFTVDGVKYRANIKRVSEKPLKWTFFWFTDEDGNNYDQSKFLKLSEVPTDYLKKDETWWDEWGQWTLAGASLIAACFGPVGLLVSIGLDLVAAADLYIREDDTIGAGVSVVLAFLPVIGDGLRIGKIGAKDASRLAKEFAPLKTKAEILNKVEELRKVRPNDAYLVTKLIEENPEKIGSLIEKSIFDKAATAQLTKEQVSNLVGKMNELVKEGSLSKSKATTWFNNLGLRRFGFDMLATGGVMFVGAKIKEKQIDNKISYKGTDEKPKTHDQVKKLFDDENN